MAPVIIPALASGLDRLLKQVRTLCSVCVLRHYPDTVKNLLVDRFPLFLALK